MYTIKVLLRAAAATLTLGVGVAVAQESPSGGTPDYWGAKNAAAMAQTMAPTTSGNAVAKTHSFWMHSNSAGSPGAVGGDGAGG